MQRHTACLSMPGSAICDDNAANAIVYLYAEDMRKTKQICMRRLFDFFSRDQAKAKSKHSARFNRYADYTRSTIDSYASSASSPLLQTHSCLGSVDVSAEPVRHSKGS